jgi:hypothetical protein
MLFCNLFNLKFIYDKFYFPITFIMEICNVS